MAEFRTAGIVVKIHDNSVANTLQEVIELLHSLSITVVLDKSTEGLVDAGPTANLMAADVDCDVVIVIGGDGTLLHAARNLVDKNTPLIGVNRGRLGFLVDVPPGNGYQTLQAILDGVYQEEDRFLLDIRVLRDGKAQATSSAFNDVVIRVKDMLQIMDYDILIDDQLVTHQRADGLVVATPSGSTAYSLSNGGPIVGPSIEALVLQPICPHTLTSRPLMVDANSAIRVHIWDDEIHSAQVICDGQVYMNAGLGDMIEIKVKSERIKLLHPENYDYHKILREKLNWG